MFFASTTTSSGAPGLKGDSWVSGYFTHPKYVWPSTCRPGRTRRKESGYLQRGNIGVEVSRSERGPPAILIPICRPLSQSNVPQQPGLGGIIEDRIHPSTWAAWGMLHESVVAPTDDGNGVGKAVPFEASAR